MGFSQNVYFLVLSGSAQHFFNNGTCYLHKIWHKPWQRYILQLQRAICWYFFIWGCGDQLGTKFRTFLMILPYKGSVSKVTVGNQKKDSLKLWIDFLSIIWNLFGKKILKNGWENAANMLTLKNPRWPPLPWQRLIAPVFQILNSVYFHLSIITMG